MSARPSDEARSEGARLHPMAVPDLPAVVALEQQVYSHPWSRGNFIDSMAAGRQSPRRYNTHGHTPALAGGARAGV